MSEPTKPGYYWAKIKGGDKWEVVEAALDFGAETLEAYMTGSDISESLSRFTFGPEVTKPEGLE